MARQTTKALDGATIVIDSAWIGVGHLSQLSIHVFGMVALDIVQIEGSNEDTPANGIKIGSDITADGLIPITTIPDKVRVRLTDVTGGGTVTALVAGNTPG